MYSTYNFSYARTALRQGLFLLNPDSSFTVALPDFICDVVLHPLKELNLRIVFYPLNDDLTPVWSELLRLHRRTPFNALIMVHYFGFPQDINKFTSFCTTNGLYLIEDASHCSGGKILGRSLGSFGDIGISSPRKMLNKQYGAHLFVKNKLLNSTFNPYSYTYYPPFSLKAFLKLILPRHQLFFRILNIFRNPITDWSDPLLFQEPTQSHYSLPFCSSFSLRRTFWPRIIMHRRSNWNFWRSYFSSVGIDPIFPSLPDHICPWVFPFYAADLKQRNLILQWGQNNSIPLFSWPVLPLDSLSPSSSAYLRWQRLVCIPLDLSYQITYDLTLSS